MDKFWCISRYTIHVTVFTLCQIRGEFKGGAAAPPPSPSKREEKEKREKEGKEGKREKREREGRDVKGKVREG